MKAPADLSPTAAKWFTSVANEYDLQAASELGVLAEAARSLTRIEECRALLARDGLLTMGARGVVAHPAVRIEQQHRNLFLVACRSLGISQPRKDAPL